MIVKKLMQHVILKVKLTKKKERAKEKININVKQQPVIIKLT